MKKVTAHFYYHELQCPCCMRCEYDDEFLRKLELVRVEYGKAMTPTSGCRCPIHNQKVGGAADSLHLMVLPVQKSRAVDIAVANKWDRYKLVELALKHGFTGIGIGADYIHIDTRTTTPIIWIDTGRGYK